MECIRNAYAIPAKGRRNAGPMVHRAPARTRAQGVERCLCCGTWMDEGDTSLYCVNCEKKEGESWSR